MRSGAALWPALALPSVVASAGTAVKRRPNLGIVNGDLVTDPSLYPFVAMTWMPSSTPTYPDNPAWDDTFCDGSLIADRWVLTAAHCKEDSETKVGVSLHRSNYSKPSKAEGGMDFKVVASFVNPGYAHETDSQYDMMLLKLDSAVPASVATPITLDDGKSSIVGPATVIGFGSSDLACKTYCTAALGCPLRKGEVTIPEDSECRKDDSLYDPKYNVCAAGQPKQQTSPGNQTGPFPPPPSGGWVNSGCGDSGGPLVVKRNGKLVQVGIVSWGSGDTWDFYVRPSGSLDWIMNTMKNN